METCLRGERGDHKFGFGPGPMHRLPFTILGWAAADVEINVFKFEIEWPRKDFQLYLDQPRETPTAGPAFTMLAALFLVSGSFDA